MYIYISIHIKLHLQFLTGLEFDVHWFAVGFINSTKMKELSFQ